jgi:hypothetical protein
MIFGFALKLAVAVFGVGALLFTLSKNAPEYEWNIFGIIVMCLGVFIGVFSVGQEDDQTKDIKAGLCIAKETEMYQPPVTKTDLKGEDIIPEAYLRTRYECPATEFYREPQ